MTSPLRDLKRADFVEFQSITTRWMDNDIYGHVNSTHIAGKGIANPLATILAAAMLLRHSLHLNAEAECIEQAVRKVLAQGHRTADLVPRGMPSIGTDAMTDRVLDALHGSA